MIDMIKRGLSLALALMLTMGGLTCGLAEGEPPTAEGAEIQENTPAVVEAGNDAPANDVPEDDKSWWLPLRTAVERDGYAYVRTRAENVKVYQRENLLDVLGILPEKGTLLLAVGYVAKEGDKLDTALVCFSDGVGIREGYVPIQRLEKTVEEEAALLATAEAVEGEAVQPALKDSPFLWQDTRPVATVSFEATPAEAEEQADTQEKPAETPAENANEPEEPAETPAENANAPEEPAETPPEQTGASLEQSDDPAANVDVIAEQPDKTEEAQPETVLPTEKEASADVTPDAYVTPEQPTADTDADTQAPEPDDAQAPTEPAKDEAPATVTATTLKSEINFRPQPDKSSGRIFLIASAGTQVEVLAQTTDTQGQLWYQVRYKDKEGFILGELLSLTEGAEVPPLAETEAPQAPVEETPVLEDEAAPMEEEAVQPEATEQGEELQPVASQGEPMAPGVEAKTAVSKVIFRDAPSSDGKRLVRIENAGTVVEALARVSNEDGTVWYQVRYEDQVGYILADMLLVPENASIPPADGGQEPGEDVKAEEAAEAPPEETTGAAQLPVSFAVSAEQPTFDDGIIEEPTETITAFYSEERDVSQPIGVIPLIEGETPMFPESLTAYILETDVWTDIPVSAWTDEDGDGRYTPVWNRERFALGVEEAQIPFCTVVETTAEPVAMFSMAAPQSLMASPVVTLQTVQPDADGNVWIGDAFVNLGKKYQDDAQALLGASDAYLQALVTNNWFFDMDPGSSNDLRVTPKTGQIYGWYEPLKRTYDCTASIKTSGNHLAFIWNLQKYIALEPYRFINRVPDTVTLPVPIRLAEARDIPDGWSFTQQKPTAEHVSMTNTRCTLGDLRERIRASSYRSYAFSISQGLHTYLFYQLGIDYMAQIGAIPKKLLSDETISWDFGAAMDVYYTIDIAPITVGGNPYLCPDSLPDTLGVGGTIAEERNNYPAGDVANHYFGTESIQNGTEVNKPLGTISRINENAKDSGDFTGDRKYGQYGDATCFNCNPWSGYVVDKVYVYVYDPLTEELLPGYPKAYDTCKEANEATPALLGKTEIRVAYRLDIPVQKLWGDRKEHKESVTLRFQRRAVTRSQNGTVTPIAGALWEDMADTLTLDGVIGYRNVYTIRLEEKNPQVYQYRLVEAAAIPGYVVSYAPSDGIYTDKELTVVNMPTTDVRITKIWQDREPANKDIRANLILGMVENGTFRALNRDDLSWLGMAELPVITWDGAYVFSVNGLPQSRVTLDADGQIGVTPVLYALQETTPVSGYNDPVHSNGVYAVDGGTITNPYATAAATIRATKLVDGKPSAVSFGFTATIQPIIENGQDVTADRVTPASASGTNDGSGQIKLGAFTFLEPGTYVFEIKEDIAHLSAGYIGDESTYYAHVSVKRNQTTGRLEQPSVVYGNILGNLTSTPPSFRNITLPMITLSAQKTFTGGNIANRQFRFQATQTAETDGNGNAVAFTPASLTAYCDAQGIAAFTPIPVRHLGVYTYRVEELPGADGTILYSGASYTVQATVAVDAQSGASGVSYAYSVEHANGGVVERVPSESFARPVPFENKKMTQLRLQKVVEDGGIGGQADVNFLFTVTINGQPYAGEYLSSMQGRNGATTNGVIPLRGSETVTLPHLSTGASYAVAEQPVDGYSVAYRTPVNGTLAPEDNLVTVVNTPLRGSLTLYKYGEDALNYSLAGAKYVLYTESSTGRVYYAVSGGVVRWIGSQVGAVVLTTTDNGVTIHNLPLGTYYMVEVAPPNGYYLDITPTPVRITVKPANSSGKQSDADSWMALALRLLGVRSASAEGAQKSFMVVDGVGSQVDKLIPTPAPIPGPTTTPQEPYRWDQTSDQTNQAFFTMAFLISLGVTLALAVALLLVLSRRRKGR